MIKFSPFTGRLFLFKNIQANNASFIHKNCFELFFLIIFYFENF